MRERSDAAAGVVISVAWRTGSAPSVLRCTWLPTIAATLYQHLTTARANHRNGDIVEEPSVAELAVLQRLATDLSRREISARLYISLNTVKTHTSELYRKLA